MLVTALSRVIGYDRALAIAHKANDEGTTLREAALATGYITGADYDAIADPTAMVGRRRGIRKKTPDIRRDRANRASDRRKAG